MLLFSSIWFRIDFMTEWFNERMTWLIGHMNINGYMLQCLYEVMNEWIPWPTLIVFSSKELTLIKETILLQDQSFDAIIESIFRIIARVIHKELKWNQWTHHHVYSLTFGTSFDKVREYLQPSIRLLNQLGSNYICSGISGQLS